MYRMQVALTSILFPPLSSENFAECLDLESRWCENQEASRVTLISIQNFFLSIRLTRYTPSDSFKHLKSKEAPWVKSVDIYKKY